MKLVSRVYSTLTQLQRKLHQDGIFPQVHVSKPVLSIGNLTFGGTGKTPFVLALVEELRRLKVNPGIVVRSYKASAVESGLVTKESDPAIWGDEACWYASKTDVPIYSGPKKWRSAELASKNAQIDVVILDDGFQHHKLFKDRNFILFDAVAGFEDLENHARDSVQSLRWAQAVVITRTNLVAPSRVDQLVNLIPKGIPVFYAETLVKQDSSLVAQESSVLLVSGVANPESFELLFRKNFASAKIHRLDFADHRDFNEKDLERIGSTCEREQIGLIVITEKDEVKLQKLKALWEEKIRLPWHVLRIESKFQDQEAWERFLQAQLKDLKK